jgi:uncharacterized protein YbjT (DUF2867 family)
MSILVIGGAGQTGSLIVKQLQQLGQTIKILSRHAKATKTAEVIRGDITNPESVAEAVKSIQGVVVVVESSEDDSAPNSPEKVHYQGTLNVLNALGRKAAPLLLVSQIYITRPERYPEVANIIHWRAQAEEAIRQSGQTYAIVRPSWLTDDPGGKQAVRLAQGDTGEGKVSRADVAMVCAAALLQPAAHGKTFEVYGEKGKPTVDWWSVFSALRADVRVSV